MVQGHYCTVSKSWLHIIIICGAYERYGNLVLILELWKQELGEEVQAYGFLGDIWLDMMISSKALGRLGLFCARYLQNTENIGMNETQLFLIPVLEDKIGRAHV